MTTPDGYTPLYCSCFTHANAEWKEVDVVEEVVDMPEWCEMRNIVYHQGEYLKVVGEIGYDAVILSNGKQASITELVEARLRPFNEKEMRELVGKTITYKTSEEVFLVTYFNKVHVGLGHLCLTAEDLLNKYTKVDGTPCGVYEHFENGEWVK
jgi:hypothetical protein